MKIWKVQIRPDRTGANHFPGFRIIGAEALLVANANHDPVGLGGTDHAVAILHLRGHGFFDQDVLPVFDGGQRLMNMGIVRRADDDGVNIFPRDQRTGRGLASYLMPGRQSRSPAAAGNRHQLGVRLHLDGLRVRLSQNPEPVIPKRIFLLMAIILLGLPNVSKSSNPGDGIHSCFQELLGVKRAAYGRC